MCQDTGSWFFLLVCDAQSALSSRYQQQYMFPRVMWLSFRIVQIAAPGIYRLMHSVIRCVDLPGVVCLMHPHDFLGVHMLWPGRPNRLSVVKCTLVCVSVIFVCFW